MRCFGEQTGGESRYRYTASLEKSHYSDHASENPDNEIHIV